MKLLSRLRSRLHELTLSDLDISDYDTLSICDRSLPFSEPDSQCHHCGAMSTLTRDSTRACDPIRISDSSNPGPPRMSESSVMDQVRISESSNTDVPRKPVRTKSMQRGDRPQGISSTTSMPQMDQSQRLQDLQNELIQVKMIKYYCASMRVRIKTVKCLCVSRRVKSQTILLSLGNHRVNPLSAGFRFYCQSVLSRKRT